MPGPGESSWTWPVAPQVISWFNIFQPSKSWYIYILIECIYIYVCVCMYACMHVCMYVCIYIYRYNVGNTIINHPPKHNFYRWYGYHSQSWVVYDIVLPPGWLMAARAAQTALGGKHGPIAGPFCVDCFFCISPID